MGKNLKGKEIGKDIYQRKDGLYHARFVDRHGRQHSKYFKTLPEARNWVDEGKYANTHSEIVIPTETTVDEWFTFWMGTMFKSAKMNDLIAKHPMDGVRQFESNRVS